MKKIAALLLLVAANAFAEPPSIESLFKLPQFAAMRISPDGSSIAALAPVAGRQNLVVLDTRTRKPFPVTGFTDRDIVDVRWVNSKRLLVRTATLNTRESDYRGGGLYAWYFYARGASVPAVGQNRSAYPSFTKTVPQGAKTSTGYSTKGGTVSRGGFGSSSKGGSTGG